MNNSILIKVLDLIDGGYWGLIQWKEWADAVMLKLDEPPCWVIELSMARDQVEAISILRESLAEVGYVDDVDHKFIVLGFLFLRYKEKSIDLEEFLTLAWQETEGEEDVSVPSNAEIFEMYEEYKHCSGSDEHSESVVNRISEAFYDNSECAAKALLEVNSYT